MRRSVSHPAVPIVCGGEHFTAVAALVHASSADRLHRAGRGEETAVALFRALETGHRHVGDPGIAYRDRSTAEMYVSQNERRDRIKDVDEIPWPAWGSVRCPGLRRAQDGHRASTTGAPCRFWPTRGCPYQCTYCSSPNMWTTRWYAREPRGRRRRDRALQREFGATNFPFQDLTAILKRDWVVNFTKEILRAQASISPGSCRPARARDHRRRGRQAAGASPGAGRSTSRRSRARSAPAST